MRVGQLLAGRYRLQEQIGAGGMGVVWRAIDEELGRTVAVKRGHPGAPADRIRREARMVAALHHPGVVTVYDIVVADGSSWLVMEYVPADSLGELIERHGAMPPRQVARIGAQLAQALAAVHGAGVLHRDVKPGNVLVTRDGTVKLTDFGISRTAGGEPTLTDGGLVGGTPAYLPQEVANGHKHTAASDVFSLGATLYAAVEGRPPYGSGTAYASLRRAARGDVAPTRRAGALAPVLAKLLHPKPSRRPDPSRAAGLLHAVAEGAGAGIPALRRPVPRLAATVTAAAVLLSALVSADTASPPGPGRTAVRSAGHSGGTSIPDSRAADPCGLLDPAGLSRFGEADLDTDYGNFNRCDVLVRPPGGGEVDVEVQLVDGDGDAPPKNLTVQRPPGSADECERAVMLADGHVVVVTAKLTEDGATGLCRLADHATDHAVKVLRERGVPRRTVPLGPASLARLDACRLLDYDALHRVPGVDPKTVETGYANWECRWHSTAGDLHVLLRFDRNQPLTSEDGQPRRFGGYQGYVQPDGDGDHTCLIRTVYRSYRDPDLSGGTAVELLFLVVAGDASTDQLCGYAAGLAGDAAAALR